MATPPPNLEFSQLSKAVSLYTPPSEPSTPNPDTDPTTIIICQWMGASPRSRGLNTIYHQHHSLFPHARIITIRSLPEFFMITSTTSRLAMIKPAIAAIEADPVAGPRILVHLFSNGGSLEFVDVCTLYKKATGQILPVKAIVLDSSPGQPTLMEGWTAMSISLPKGLMWYPGAAVIITLLGITSISKNVFGIENIIEKTRRWLNDWTTVDKRAKRLYVYSENDKLVGWRDVERHAEEARREGVDVSLLRETETPHVQHAFKDSERYWLRVKELWDSVRG
ncbi:uncharacterized protein LY89DRAFT_688243 [Mollisia scopiformis]|uniref:Indole-diterpene biosynthesis protein PaxU n=1 Tax=Mollisia scopiformis TaxID=149040 RepID=A0A194WX81_MOLSC|nr:uncharacterized protein LY89DRAFT_688243 [Mollisia scopiformis]KUJ12591.1 hypothetical protein LY89DRAFT_688243 [Mollisia scopiformis]